MLKIIHFPLNRGAAKNGLFLIPEISKCSFLVKSQLKAKTNSLETLFGDPEFKNI